MRYEVSPEFSAKLSAVQGTADVLSGVATFLNAVAEAKSVSDLPAMKRMEVQLLEQGVFAARIGSVRIFYVTGRRDDQDYVLLLDIAVRAREGRSAGPTASARNPAHNPKLNPKFNSSINPKFNSSINPKLNSAINPKFNSSINPKFNSSINPKFNVTVNWRFNATINPKLNASLNPKFNASLNPRLNPGFAGPFVYDRDLTTCGFVVRGNEEVLLFFENNLAFKGLAVKTSTGYAVFDLSNEWVGYLISDKQGGYLRFDIDGEWTGLIV